MAADYKGNSLDNTVLNHIKNGICFYIKTQQLGTFIFFLDKIVKGIATFSVIANCRNFFTLSPDDIA